MEGHKKSCITIVLRQQKIQKKSTPLYHYQKCGQNCNKMKKKHKNTMQVCIKKINDRKTLKKLICHQMHAKHQNLHLLNFPHKLAPQNIKKNSHQKLTKHWRAQKKKKTE